VTAYVPRAEVSTLLQAVPGPDGPYWSRARLELLGWLRRNAPSLAELYEGSVRLVFETPLPGWTRFVAHGVREIRNRLPGVISGERGSTRLDYTNRMDDIAKAWKRAGFTTDGTIPTIHDSQGSVQTPSPEVPLPRRVVLLVAKLVSDHEKTRQRPTEAAMRLFEGLAPENQQIRNTLRPIVMQWLEITGWFQQKVHDSGVADTELDAGELRKRFELFELTLAGLVRGFFTTSDELDEILEEANS
jgi:hypothetical protein